MTTKFISKEKSIARKVYYIVEIHSSSFYFFMSLVNATLITIISLLSIEKISASAEIKGLSHFFISIIIILSAVVITKWWGVLSALLGSFLFGLGLKYGVLDSFLWSIANVLQAILLLFIFRHREIEKVFSCENLTKKFIKTSICISLLLVIATCLFDNLIYLIVFFAFLIGYNIFYAIIEKYWKVLSIIFLFFLTSLIGSVYGVSISLHGSFFTKTWWSNILVWVLSNTIILSSIGIVIVYFIFEKTEFLKKRGTEVISIRIDSLLYLFSLIIWNSLFVILYITDWFNYGFYLTYLIPWGLGFIFFCSNYFLSRTKELKLDTNTNFRELFEFIEKRAVVAETNTGTIILVLSILIPVAGSMLNALTLQLVTIFIVTISVACASIGLIWIPQGNIRLISIIKTIKTILHLYTICFLLLESIVLLMSVLYPTLNQ